MGAGRLNIKGNVGVSSLAERNNALEELEKENR